MELDIVRKMINKEFEICNITIDKILDWSEVDDKIPWYQYFTFDSEEQYNQWKDYCISTIKKELKLTKEQSIEKFQWLDLMYGFKQNYEK